jgi:hypothetical protein
VTSRERYERVAERLRERIAAGEVTPGAPVSEEAMAEAEAQLGYSLSPSFRWFLRDFGPAQFLAPPTSSEPIVARPQVLAPGGLNAADFLAAVQALRQGKDNLPVVPGNMYPVVMQTYRDRLARADVYNYLDIKDVDEDGEHRYLVAQRRLPTGKSGLAGVRKAV